MDELHKKYGSLSERLSSFKSAAVAFSGGVDSTFLLKAAHDALGENVTAITVRSCLFPKREMDEAAEFAKKLGVKHIIIDIDELSIPGFKENPPDRCYICKRELFKKMKTEARKFGAKAVLEGSNTDDMNDYRPGMTAIKELDIKSPLRDSGLSKAEIRALSREMGLPTWQKPSFACLASRFVYGEEITKEKLSKIERAEALLLDMGFTQVRVRLHGDIARIELEPSQFPLLLSEDTPERINREIKTLGFKYVTLDLGGYKTGSMNKTI